VEVALGERPRKRRLRFLDEPFLSVQLDLERLQRDLRTLATRAGSPLPERLRQQLGQMARQLGRLRREISDYPEAIAQERLRDERRFRRC
jgi:hypothetical protein